MPWLSSFLTPYLVATQAYLGLKYSTGRPRQCDSGSLRFSGTWQLLGPFQIGTREATWGADPLEFHGGFRALEYSDNATFGSALTPNATVSWSTVHSDEMSCGSDEAHAAFTIGFPSVDWASMQLVYGWAALQYQAWVRGVLHVDGSDVQRIVLYTDHILEFSVDKQHYFGGDFYAYRRAPLVLTLSPGAHRIDLRLIRDVRAMGGVGEPQIDVALTAKISNTTLALSQTAFLLPDLVDGRLASRYGSFMARNDGLHDLKVVGISSNASLSLSLIAGSRIRLKPGQTRPVGFSLACTGACPSAVNFVVQFQTTKHTGSFSSDSTVQHFMQRSISDPHKVTHMHPGAIVSYSIIRAPPKHIYCGVTKGERLPVMLQLHGAGLEAEDSLVAHALDSLPDLCAFVIFPTGVTPWSGDDWHRWGFADVEASIKSLSDWLEATKWQGLQPDIDRWLVSGHSNGGQGTWYTLTHRPDNVIAAAPVSGYSSIQNYVPYHFWQDMDPLVRSVLDGALLTYRHESLLANAEGVPVAQQHGERDENVPPYHSRLLNTLLRRFDTHVTYMELPDKGHWFEGVMTTKGLSSFYEHHLQPAANVSLALSNFTLTVANPADTGSKQGFLITHLKVPGQLGKLQFVRSPSGSHCYLTTSNILIIRLSPYSANCTFLSVDGKDLPTERLTIPTMIGKSSNVGWTVVHNPLEQTEHFADRSLAPFLWPLRSPSQSGALDSVLTTRGAFTILVGTPTAREAALQISRNLCQYFSADSDIVQKDQQLFEAAGNIILVLDGEGVEPRIYGDTAVEMPIILGRDWISIRDDRGQTRTYRSDNGLSAIFLAPLRNNALKMIVWGSDTMALDVAARLVPMLTGVGQPDFIIADRSMLWKGAGGVLALGFFDAYWNVSRSSYLT